MNAISPFSPSARVVAALREQVPLVQCLTNQVVMNFTANVLYAVGAAPVMVDNPEEAADFAAGAASAILINTGTPSAGKMHAMHLATTAAAKAGKPWVLDPVAAGALPWRTDQAQHMMSANPATILRGNASEIIGFAGGLGGRGVDATETTSAALDAATHLARTYHCVVAVSGPTDVITDGDQTVRLENGHPLLTKVTGIGCALGAVMAAYSAVTTPLDAAITATSHMNIAAEDAAAGTTGPGSFAVALLDALANLTPDEIVSRTNLS